MAHLEFAILQHLDGNMRIVLKRNENQVLERLKARVQENLGRNDDAVNDAIDKAFNGLISEFKNDSIRII